MVVRSYHDGSGKEDNPSAKFMTLAGFCATAKVWDTFDCQFLETLIRLEAPRYLEHHPYIHMREATTQKGGYARWPGKLSELVMSLLALIPAEIEFFACTVNLDDFKKVKPKLHPKVTSPSAVCAEWCFTRIRIPQAETDGPVAVELYYDRNEKFLGAIDKYWRLMPENKRRGWMRELAVISAVENSKILRPMQLADMAAWILNRHFSIGDRENWRLSLEFSTMRNSARVKYDYESLLNDFGPNGRLAPPQG